MRDNIMRKIIIHKELIKIDWIEEAMDSLLKIKIDNNENLIAVEECFYKLNELRKLELNEYDNKGK